MKYFKLSLMTLVLSQFTNAHAFELVCRGDERMNPQQRPLYVNCESRKSVVDALEGAWMLLRRERIGGKMEDLCWEPFRKANDMYPGIPMSGIAPAFFAQCNIALENVN